MQSLTELMKDVEGRLDAFLQGEIGKRAWRRSGGEGQPALVMGRHTAWCVWNVDKDTLLPRIELWNDGERYSIIMKRTPCPDVVIYEWQCWDSKGIAEDIDYSCACRGKIIFP